MDKITDDNGKTVKKYGVKKVRQLHYDTTYWNAVHTGMRGVVSGKRQLRKQYLPRHESKISR